MSQAAPLTTRRRRDRRLAVALLAASIASLVAGGAARAGNEQSTDRAGCGTVNSGIAPTWTRFGAPSRTPFLASDAPRIAGFVFTKAIRAGHPTTPHNKILWILNDGSADRTLTLTARRAGTTEIARRHYRATDGAGRIYPSYLDLPTPGCWHLAFTWNAKTTRLSVLVETRTSNSPAMRRG
jgi:hypothetical protein